MKTTLRSLLAMLALAVLPIGDLSASGKPVTVKLASLAPNNSIWDQVVEEMGADWRERTDGRVVLRVYPGGVAGDEPAVVRKMRIGQLHAAVLTAGGLSDIEPSFGVFGIPFLFDSYEELYYVLDQVTPELKKRLEAKGYVLLNWGHAGWIHLFSTRPVETVAEMKNVKLFVAAGDDEAVQWWKEAGFRPVALATTDILTGLQTGMVEAVPSPPLATLLLQWYKHAPSMLDIGFAPLVGGTVVNKRIWNRISAADRTALQAAARKVEDRLETEVPEQDRKSIAEMEKRGLAITKVEGTANAGPWRAAAERLADLMKERRVPVDVLEMVLKARDEYRSSQAPTAAGG